MERSLSFQTRILSSPNSSGLRFYGGVLDLFGLEVSGGNLLRAELPKDTWESAQNGAQNDEISVLFLIVYRVALARRFLTETCSYLFWE